MNLKSITFDTHGMPAGATVAMTIEEVAAIARVFGNFNYYAQLRLGLADSGIFDCLTGGVINPYWERGIDELLPRVDLATIKEPS